jgi:UDP-N-acetylglucosamine--N-acetylmuramyl-(pentapeptide) pyrophosphoryl-undecaprenol N-acetylglucosamine transferase
MLPMTANLPKGQRKLVVLAAGGTGGHLFPAQALGEALVRRDCIVHLMTDERVREYGRSFPAIEIHQIPSATLSLRKPHLLPFGLLRLWKGVKASSAVLGHLRPWALVGFGGYPSFPPVLAASRLGIPTIIHEQNAVMGRANRVLARRAGAIASSFPAIANLPAGAKEKLRFTGNPVREIAIQQRSECYEPPHASGPFRLVVFGGSQGARFFAEFMPQVVNALPKAVVKTLKLTQQCRKEDLKSAETAYARLGIEAELAPFFNDMPKRIAAAHLVICRSGASTIAELGVIGRPAVLIPLPHSIDNDQLRNAESFASSGAGWVKPQAELRPDEFATFLTQLRYDETGLADAAEAAKSGGRPDAAERLADLVEEMAGSRQREKVVQ